MQQLGLTRNRKTRPMMGLRLMVVLLGAQLLQHAAAQTNLVQYPLDWTVVPVTPSTSLNLTANCTCNLRPDACNLGCCCDPLCPSGLNQLFIDQGRCSPDGNDEQTLTYCVPKGLVSKVNLPSSGDFYYITKQQADVKFWSELMCIVSDNNPNLGENYPDPPAGAVGDNVALAQCPVARTVPSPAASYQFTAPVQAQRPNSTLFLPLTVPYPAFSATCSDQFQVGFLLPVPSGSQDVYAFCQRSVAALDFADVCSGTGLLTPQYYAGMQFAKGDGSTTPVSVTVSSLQYLDPLNGSLVDAANATSSYDNATSRCLNVVTYLNITFIYVISDASLDSAPGYIDSVYMSFVVTDVDVGALAPGPLLQGVKVSWLPLQTPQPIDLQTSGNPGYVVGLPLLAGTLATFTEGTTDKRAVSRLVGGMPLPAPGQAGACSPTSLTAARFGFNTSSSCSVSLDADELESFCKLEQNNPQKYVQQVLGPLYSALTNDSGSQLYVGIWGNSDFNDISQWLQVSVENYPFQNAQPVDTQLACSGVITGFDLQIVTGVAFSSNNLQHKVLYATLCFRVGVWDGDEGLPRSQKQRYFLDFTVSYISLPQQPVPVKKPAPPLVVPLPADIFYPFVEVTGASAALSPSWWLVLGACLAMGVLHQMLEA